MIIIDELPKKQKTIVFGSDSESGPNKVSMKLVDFNVADSDNTC